jgi:hypothetical protein
VLVFFGTSGDLSYLQQLVADCGFVSEVVARDEMTRDGWRVEYFTFRLSSGGRQVHVLCLSGAAVGERKAVVMARYGNGCWQPGSPA